MATCTSLCMNDGMVFRCERARSQISKFGWALNLWDTKFLQYVALPFFQRLHSEAERPEHLLRLPFDRGSD